MAILTEADKAFYFPSLDLSGNALSAFLLRIQAYAESSWGCNRKLEIQSKTEICNVNQNSQTAQLSLQPIVSIDAIEGRQKSGRNRYNRRFGTTNWQEVPSASQIADFQEGSGQIHLNYTPLNSFQYQWNNIDQIRVTYTCGFAFDEGFDTNVDPVVATITISDDAKTIKATLGAFAEFLAKAEGLSDDAIAMGSAGAMAGPIIEQDTYQVAKTKFSDVYGKALTGGDQSVGDNLRSLAENWLFPLKKWQPRRWR